MDPSLILLLLVSPAVGSFLGVVVERLPVGASLLAPSSCAHCGQRLAWREMVPVLSALALGQRCARCAAPIPGHLLRIELAAIIVAVAALLIGVTAPHAWALALCLWCLVALFYIDLLHFRLPDPLTAALFFSALLAVWADPGRGVWEALLSGLGLMAVFAALRWGYQIWRGREGLGLGDVKLAFGLGLLIGWQDLPLMVLIAALLAIAASFLNALKTRDKSQLRQPIPFGAYLAGATLLILVI